MDAAGVAEEVVRDVEGLYGASVSSAPNKDGRSENGNRGEVDGPPEDQRDGSWKEPKDEGATPWLVYSCTGARLRKGGKVQVTQPAPDVRADWCLEWQL